MERENIMAIRKNAKRDLSRLELVAESDDAIDVEKSDYDAYIEAGLDEKHLVFKEGAQPTRWILNFQLKGKEAERIKNASLSGKDAEGKPGLAFGSLSFAVTRLCLKEIVNPTDLPVEEAIVMRKDAAGYVHDDLIGVLDRAGVVQSIWSAYASLVLSPVKAEAKN